MNKPGYFGSKAIGILVLQGERSGSKGPIQSFLVSTSYWFYCGSSAEECKILI